jgi:hypothetical protein
MALTKVSYAMIEGSPLNIMDFGAVGDGSTDNYAAFTAAFAAAEGKKLIIPAGTYDIQFTGSTGLTVPANIIIEGEGVNNTIINFVPSSTTYRNLFDISENMVTVRDVAVTATVPTNGQIGFFNLNASYVYFESCKFDGAVTNVGSTLSHLAYGIVHPSSGTQNTLYVNNCIFRQLTYPFLKANASTSTQSNIRVINSIFSENYYNDLGLNGPNGAIDDVVITNNRFVANRTVASVGPTQALGVALASVSNFSIANNVFEGVYTNAIHIEENSVIGSISGNTITVDGNGIEFNGAANNSAGIVYSPADIAVTNNSIYKSGTAKEAGKYAIECIFNSALNLPAKDIVIANNVVFNFDVGIYTVVRAQYAVSITDNIVRGCTTGIKVLEGALTISGNTTDSCTTGIGNAPASGVSSGIINEHCFIDCTTPVDGLYFPFTLCNPKFIFSPAAIAASSSATKNILPTGANDRIYGFLEVAAVTEATFGGSSNRATEVTWDGASFTGTSKIVIQAGSFTTTIGASGSMYVQMNNTSGGTAIATAYLEAKLNGMAVIAA